MKKIKDLIENVADSAFSDGSLFMTHESKSTKKARLQLIAEIRKLSRANKLALKALQEVRILIPEVYETGGRVDAAMLALKVVQ